MGRAASSDACYYIRFAPLGNASRALAFRCDANGQVEFDALDERQRIDYLFARTLVGRDFARPAVVRADLL